MPDSTDIDALTDDVIAAAQKPQSATIDGNTVSQQSIDDKIKAANYTANQVVGGSRTAGWLKFRKLIPPGCG